MLALLEDAHWIDPSSLELFDRLSTGCRHCGAFLHRHVSAGIRAALGGAAACPVADAEPVRAAPRRCHDRCVAGGKALPAEVLEQIVAKTDGVPLFVEELTKTVLSPGCCARTTDRYGLPRRCRRSRFPRPCRTP